MNEENKRLLLAVVISGVILIVWQYFFAPKMSTAPVSSASVSKVVDTPVSSTNDSAKNVPVNSNAATTAPVVFNNPTKVEVFLNDVRYYLNNNLELQDVAGLPVRFPFKDIVDSPRPFRVEVLNGTNYEPISFDQVIEELGNKWVYKSTQYQITASMEIDEKKKLQFKLLSNSNYKYKIVFNSKPLTTKDGRIRQFLYFANDVERIDVGDTENGEGIIKWAGIDFHYHLFAAVFSSKLAAKYSCDQNGNFEITIADAVNDLSFYTVYAKKGYDYLGTLGDNLDLAVDFGFFGIIAVPLLRALEFTYKYFPNYGVAIIIVTLLFRFITFPLQYKSSKSMKKMQVIQPEIQKIREKFKDDPQRLQKETMDLFKRHGANPLGGCIPLLIQMPFFFAIWQVLSQAVELVDAPFIWWIQDLSSKDPYYILPIVSSLALLLQQVWTPMPTTDPMQKKIMYIMPVVFGFIFKDMAAGLCLYMFVSTLFGIGQQVYINKFVK